MRDLRRNQVPFWYSLYVGKEDVLKDGLKTGQKREIYTDAFRAEARISNTTGEIDTEMFGANVQYDRVISTVQDLPINEYSRLWIEADPTTGAKHDYVVKRVARGLTQNLWAIAKVV